MRCEEAKNLIGTPVPEEKQQEWSAHLNQCEACRDLHQADRLMAEAARAWRDEPMPGAAGVVPFPRSSTLTPGTLVLAAACLLMGFLVLLRVEVRHDAGGWSATFGEQVDQRTVQAAVQEALAIRDRRDEVLKTMVQEAVAASQNQTAAQVQAAFARYQRDQNAYFKQLLVEYDDRKDDERKEEMALLLTSWDEQRRDDLALVERHMKTLLSRQNQNATNLYQLAGYVNRGNRSQP